MLINESYFNMYWTTKSGMKIPIKKLDDNHIVNIVKLYVRKAIEHKTIPESLGLIFSNILDEAESKNLDVGYCRYKVINNSWETYIRFPKFAIKIFDTAEDTYKEKEDCLLVKVNNTKGDISEYTYNKELICLPKCYQKALDLKIEEYRNYIEYVSDEHEGEWYL